MKVLTFIPRCTLQRRIARALSAPPFIVESVMSAEDCLRRSQLARFEAVLLDADSLKFSHVLASIKQLRHENSHLSLFVVFERSLDLDQRLRLFDAGADDCMREPFFDSEFAMRLRLSIRLRQAASNLWDTNGITELHCGDLEMDLMRRTVTRQGKVINLRSKEFLLLEYLVRNVNRPVTRTMIIEHVWQSSFEGLTNVVDVYINALRNKVDRDFAQKLIQTNRGVGYTFTCVPAQALVRQELHGSQGMFA